MDANELKALKEERAKRWDDLYRGIIPDRVPIDFNLSTEVYIEEYGLPLGKTLWTLEHLEDAFYNMAQHLPADMLPKDSGRLPFHSIVSGNLGVQMGSGGFMQHPEVHTMEPEEYDEFIESPYDFVLSKAIPRLFSNMTGVDPARAMAVFYMSIKSKNDTMARYGQAYAKVSERLGYYAIPGPMGSRSLAPLDFVADYQRGFTGMSKDLKRCPEKVKEASDAVVPLLVKYAKPAVKSHLGSAWMPGHMPTFMRTKEFEKLYYPSFSKLIHATAENGQAFKIFCEDDWTRYLDYLRDLPQGTRLLVEKGDPKVWKDKLGDKMILSGFYPIMLLKTGTKEECIDKMKELIDTLGPGGNWYFNFDKTIITLNSIKVENLYAVIQYLAENGKYDNAGERAWKQNTEDTIHKCLDTLPPVNSKYYKTREQIAEEYKDYILEDCREILYDQVAAIEYDMMKNILGCF